MRRYGNDILTPSRPLKALLLALACAAALAAVPGAAQAQPMAPSARQGDIRRPAPAEVVQAVGVDQKLDGQIPLDLTFRDESGKVVRLGDYFGRGRAVVLTPVYYECPMLCTMTLNGITKALRPMELTVGKDFDVITVSFDPTETPELAAKKKANYVKQYGRPEAEGGWHFLTGDEASVKALMESVGFRYTFDPKTDQYAHASSIMVLTPRGRISRYFYGLEYSSRDVKLGLIEASENRIGSVADAVVLLCYAYDASTGKYSFAIMKTLQAMAVLTVVALGGFVLFSIRRESRGRRAARQAVSAPERGAEPVGKD